jgi:hypothetical protein
VIEGENWYLLHLQEKLIRAFPKASTNKDDIYVVGGKYGMTRQEIFDLGFQNEEFGNAVFRSDLGGDFMKYTVRRGQGEAAKVIATGMDLAMPLPPILTLARGVRFARSSTTSLSRFYPANSGFLGATERTFLMPGQQISRYGSASGRYFSPAGTPLSMRALPPGANTRTLNNYRVLKPFEVQAGRIAPAFGQPGLGTQFLSPVPTSTLMKRGIIAPIR